MVSSRAAVDICPSVLGAPVMLSDDFFGSHPSTS